MALTSSTAAVVEEIILIVICLKGDYIDLPDLLGRDRWRLYSVHDGFKMGLNCPADSMPSTTWLTHCAKVLAANCGMIMSTHTLTAMMRFLMGVLNTASGNGPLLYPSIPTLYELTNKAPQTTFAFKSSYWGTLTQSLAELADGAVGIFDVFRGFDLHESLIKPGYSAVIDLTALPLRLVCIIVDLLCLQLLLPRLYNRLTCDTTKILLVIDECDPLVSERTASLYPEGISPLGMLMKQGREFGIMVALGLSHLSQASQFIRSNVSYNFLFAQPDHQSVFEAARTMMIPRGGEAQFTTLEPGQCICRESQGPASFPMLAQVDHIPASRATRPEKFDQHAYIPSKPLDEMPHVKEALEKLISQRNRQKREQKQLSDDTITVPARELLSAAASNPWHPVVRLWEGM